MTSYQYLIIYITFILNTNVSTETTTEFDVSTEEYTTVGGNFTLESTVCDLNGTCTDINVSTTPKPLRNLTKVTNKPKTKPTKKSSRELQFPEQRTLCTCDLKWKYCDINCCCDKDCIENDKKLFTHCIQEENLFYNTRYCDFMKFIYINNTQFEWQVNQNDLFCIIKSNVPKSYTVQRRHALKSLEEAEVIKMGKYSWFNDMDSKENGFDVHEQFVYGNVVWLIDENHQISKLKIPNRLVTSDCIIDETVQNFVNKRNRCYETDVSPDKKNLNLATYFRNVSVVTNPEVLNTFLDKHKILNCPKNICIPIEHHLCDKHFKICVKPTNYSYFLQVQCSYSVINNENTCINLVKSIKYVFHHNGSEGFKKIELFASLESVSYEFQREPFRFQQEFSVIFNWINETNNYTYHRSGNPGYLFGNPILIGQRIDDKNKSRILRDSSRFPANFLVLSETFGNVCVLNDDNYNVVEFGYSLQTNCEFQTIIHGNIWNANVTCRQLQRKLLQLWPNSDNGVFGVFGNANNDNLDEWQYFLTNKNYSQMINETFGKLTNSNTTLECFNIVSKIFIDIFYERVDFGNLVNQAKIFGISMRFDGFKNISLAIRNGSVFTNLISSNVMFYDVTSEKKKRFVDAPTFKIRFPHDFFYPFVKLDNGGGFAHFHLLLFVLCLVLGVIV